MNQVKYPSLYQINTRVWLTELSSKLGRPSTLDDVPDSELDHILRKRFDWIWLLSVWQTGLAGQIVSRTNTEWCWEFQETLPDLREEDIAGSGFAITGYNVHKNLGGDAALKRFRERLKGRGIKLMLDFVPNHTAIDHHWLNEHPEYYIHGTDNNLIQTPMNYIRVKSDQGNLILAHGRDPYFPGWPDTLQLNYGNPATQEAMIAELMKIAGQCDGVRCDMAMLVLPEVFERTWGIKSEPFWSKAIELVHKRYPEFCFMAEVYWDLEWTMQQQGFDYTYDKRLYDRLRDGHAKPVREHFYAGMDYQNKLARFLENHDEPRAAATFPANAHLAAAVITFLSPGLRFFHHGQFEGRIKRISPHLVRGPEEPVNYMIQNFYDKLLKLLANSVIYQGYWQLLKCIRAWEGNDTFEAFISYAWRDHDIENLIVCVNYSDHRSQCYVHLPFDDLDNCSWQLKDLMGDSHYVYDGNDLKSRGLYLDMTPWQYHIFEIRKII
ncbi:MAG: alpha-amylase family glycosyl hydrolase [Ignavibacteria bacterium]